MVIKCPNCDHYISDTTTICPHCGVAVSDNNSFSGSDGKKQEASSSAKDSFVFPGLLEELRKNLKLQEDNPDSWVSTDLFTELNAGPDSISVMSDFNWQDGTEATDMIGSGDKHLFILLDFNKYTDVESSENVEFNGDEDTKLARFRQMDSFPMFTSHNSVYIDDNGDSRYGRQYAVDLGEDAEGAACLLTEILIKVNGWSPTEVYDIFTNVGYDNIENARDAWDLAHGFGTQEVEMDDRDDSNNDKEKKMNEIIWYAITLAGIVAYLLFFKR